MMYYIKQLKNWENLNEYHKKGVKADLMRNALFMLIGAFLYILFYDTGLLIYIILMLKYHWWSKESK